MEKRAQNSDKDKVKWFKKMGVDEVGGASAIGFDTVSVSHLHVEFRSDDEGDLIMHYFWREPPPVNKQPFKQVGSGLPTQDSYADWPANFRELLWSKLLSTFNLETSQNRVEIEWIPELSSWFVCVKRVAVIIKPPVALIKTILSELVSELYS